MFRSITEQGHFVDYLSAKPPRYAHEFCGPQNLQGAVCPNCRKPLLSFLALDLDDPRVGIDRDAPGDLFLLFCWTCELAQAPFFYRQVDRSVELLSYKSGPVSEDFPYADYPVFFPGRLAELVPVPAATQEVIRDLNRGKDIDTFHHEVREVARPRHQVGGEPYLLQGEFEPMDCFVCHLPMPFLAAIGNDCLDPRGFAGNDFVQVIYSYCRRCDLVGAYQQAD